MYRRVPAGQSCKFMFDQKPIIRLVRLDLDELRWEFIRRTSDLSIFGAEVWKNMFSKKESTDILPVGTRDVRCVRQQRRRKELILCTFSCQSSIVQVCSDIVVCSCIVCVVTAAGARRRKVFLFVRTPGRDAKFCSSKDFFCSKSTSA